MPRSLLTSQPHDACSPNPLSARPSPAPPITPPTRTTPPQLFLSSSKPVLRFAAVRTLNRVAMSHPMAVTNCNIDMEGLISDSNRSIATLGEELWGVGRGGRVRCRLWVGLGAGE